MWWEASICCTMKFMRGWGCMAAHKCERELREDKWKLEEVHILLEEDLHSITLQEDVATLEMV